MKKLTLNLDALRIEGSLFPAEFIQKLLELKADYQSATDYGIPPGLNLKDGGALTAFQVRDAAGKPLWTGGSYRSPSGQLTVFRPGELKFEARRRWRSPRTQAVYPVEQAITAPLPGGQRTFLLKPLFDDQELDSRAGGGPVYWEGAGRSQGGRGYRELTGYVSPMKL